jgi:hypothetical protein
MGKWAAAGFRVVRDYETSGRGTTSSCAEFDDANADRPAFAGASSASDHRAWRRLDLLGVRYVVSQGGHWGHPRRFRVVYRNDRRIYEAWRAFRAAFLYGYRIETNPQATLRRMRRDPLDRNPRHDARWLKSATADEASRRRWVRPCG